ncbi:MULTISPECIES: AmpG family muropeptide MFS transporter [unclassified Chelatococcus]|uniref:AmpG family muropeptide MFS transporter n=1 Tax=unclassified Chelatococcus TaxID=2638111 RepID=UPI001BCA734D|nr:MULTISPECIES: AmpG family muropeptide MFS transporter [unclassified Chelatococcus]CAH1648628.1 Anhydromuropeptide permease [Hyphomicrobiales bacterium]MBS7739474.1 AmpG family muropeptide MFS transporter [Chelatococcus sp. HY11]MBX3543843.1 AmpG family muropeptide MFS transporter [Chelatococcus sp.]MCO5075990.1 AmpG family muropeptide MFS transporter [Chelatococcus sp.]CAH1668293.1 Anhydromuropeptide permease [Hyphomicrobiales bacterium]
MNAWLRSLAVYSDPRIIAILFLGFSSGLPLSLVYGTLSAWLAEAGVSMTMIGLFSWASTAYGFKWLWSPLVDRLPIPVLTGLLGQRRAWMIVAQALTALCMIGLGSSDPAHNLLATAGWAVALAFASATQDIVIDAYRVESLKQKELGAGAGNIVLGYRLGMIVSGGGALVLAELFGWFTAYAAMAALMGIGVITVLLSREPARPDVEETSLSADPLGWIRSAVVAPLADFAQRPHWVAILLFIALYKYGDALIGVMANPFYLAIGFTKAEIGLVSKSYGVIMTIAGGLIGGVVVARLGIMRALLICGILQAASNLVFVVQAMVGANLSVFIVTMSVENLAGGMGTAAFVAYLSSLCNVAYTATQYALVSSFMAFTRTIFASGGGWLADQVDWTTYFLISTAAALPGLALLLWMMRAFPTGQTAGMAPGRA